ncbi:MAG TPA: diguanylate cyclase [Solirubrobacteraceae bacterium]|nr:diguanylate cyclase [Solirubrobacteraceae bacterium]
MQPALIADAPNMDHTSVAQAHTERAEDPRDSVAQTVEDLRDELRSQRVELRRQENRLQITMEMLAEGVLMFDANGRVVYANNAAARILSLSFDQLLSRHIRDARWKFVHDDGTPCPAASHPANETLESGRTRRNVVLGVPKANGALTWISVSTRAALDELGRACGAITTFSDITERRIILEQLEHQAHHDQLTNLANRRLFHRELERSIAQAQRNGCAVALVYMDLNGFKQINDTLGHRTGDFVLCTIAERLNGATRDDELISRYGGDEFVALLGMLNHPSQAVDAFTARMRTTLSEPIVIEAGSIRVGASFGASVYPHDGSTTDDLLHHADAAMFAMKARFAA